MRLENKGHKFVNPSTQKKKRKIKKQNKTGEKCQPIENNLVKKKSVFEIGIKKEKEMKLRIYWPYQNPEEEELQESRSKI